VGFSRFRGGVDNMKKTLESLKKIYTKLGKLQTGVVVLFLIFGAYLFLQHRLVGMYYDDFGNASLSYGYDSSNVIGTNYSLKDLLGWAKYTYFNWGGRVIYALMLIPLLKNGAHLFMMIQVVVMLVTFIIMYQIAKKFCTNANGMMIVGSFMLIYGLLNGDILTQGVYWASASVLYVWPVLPFVLIVLIYIGLEEKLEKKQRLKIYEYIVLCVVIPFVTLSQEQWGGALIVWLFFHALFKHWKNEKIYLKLDCFSIVYSGVTYGIMLAAPGNWARLSTNEEYVDMSIMERLVYGIRHVLSLLTNSQMKYFNLMLLIAGVLIIVSLWETRRIWYLLGACIGIAPFLIVDILDIIGNGYISEEIKRIAFFVFLIDMLFLLIFYFNKRKKLEFVALMLAAVASVFCLIFSPAFSLRSCLLYVFICMMFVSVVFSEGLREKNKSFFVSCITLVLVILGGVGLANIRNVYVGYEKNYYIDNYNFNTLKSYDGTADAIYLVQYDNSYYRSRMSCDKGFEYVDYWMKEYFAIPQSVTIKWRSIPELVEYAKSAVLNLQYDRGFYDDEGGYRWAEQESEIIINNVQNSEQIVQLSMNVKSGYSDSSQFWVLCNGETVYESAIDNLGIECELELRLEPGENIVEFVTDAEQIDSGADARKLFLHFSNVTCEMEN
jgi:hypothetical protein